MVCKELSKQKQICWYLQLLSNNTKITKVKSYRSKTKYGKMVIINHVIIFIPTWLTKQQQYKKLKRLL